MSYDTDNEVCSCRYSVNRIVCDFLLCMGEIMEKMNCYQNMFYKINHSYKMSLHSVYDDEWYFDYDTDYSKDRLSWKAIYLMSDEYEKYGVIYYRMCK